MTTAQSEARAELKEHGKSFAIFFIVVGVFSIGAGILALVYPGVTLAVITVIFGVNLLVFAGLDLVEAIIDDESDALSRVLGGVLALLALIAGLIVLRNPGRSLLVILMAIGIYLVIAGVVGTVRAFKELSADRAARMMSSIGVLILGVLIVSLPGLGLATLAVLAGLGLILRGIAAVFLGLVTLKSAKAA
ncbi:MAG: DUF308 domain-containing protein [Solirubrobacteraceae bacterium]|nr:DUF308 domain-containing protein [Solirubrobacteraceae bacterium]